LREPEISEDNITSIFRVQERAKKVCYFFLLVYLLGLFFDSEDGGDILLRNFDKSPKYWAL
jgi:hypothetical protein